MMGLWGCGQRACVVHISTGYRRRPEHFAWGPIAQRLVQALVVVKVQPTANAAARLLHRGVGLDVYVLVLQAAPQLLDKDVVQVTAFAVHTNADTPGRQHAGERLAGELRALIGVENIRRTVSI